MAQDILLREFFWYWQLLRLAFFEDDGDALTSTNAGRANSVLASSSPVERKKTRPITQSLLMCRHHARYTVNVGYLSWWTRWAVMRAPDAPSGCPMAIAPPLTLLFSGSRPRAFATARYWGAKASFTWVKKMTSMMQVSNNYPDKSKHKRNAVTKIKSQRHVNKPPQDPCRWESDQLS